MDAWKNESSFWGPFGLFSRTAQLLLPVSVFLHLEMVGLNKNISCSQLGTLEQTIIYTLPETNIAPEHENQWLEDKFPFGAQPIFRDYVGFREGRTKMFNVSCHSAFLTIMADNDIKLVEEMVVLEPCFPRVMITVGPVGQESNFCVKNMFYIKHDTGIYIASIPKIRNHQRAITIYIAEGDQNLPNYISEYHLDHIILPNYITRYGNIILYIPI